VKGKRRRVCKERMKTGRKCKREETMKTARENVNAKKTRKGVPNDFYFGSRKGRGVKFLVFWF